MTTFKRELLDRNDLRHFSHQIDCISWCCSLENQGVLLADDVRIRSGIIADEMGLGKTLQILGLIVEQLDHKRKTLVVLPRALLEQWRETIQDFLGHRAFVLHGAQKALDLNAPIVLTTYGTLASHGKRKSSELMSLRWDRAVFDEAHHMRNPKSQVGTAAAKLDATHKWLLTGTPIQNSVSDIKSLCRIIGIPLEHVKGEDALVAVLQKILLRRTKQMVGLKLPSLVRQVIFVKWGSPREKELAEDIHALVSFSGVVGKAKSEEQVVPHHFAVLQQSRQACIASGLLKSSVEALQEAGIISQEGQEDIELIGRSKIDKVIEVILQQPRSEKKLVFCHYRKEIDRISTGLSKQGLKVESFDGRTKQVTREELLASDEIDVLVLQIKTGCEGLNLQSFNQVYFVTPHWNPAVEDQAVARCHRQGQMKTVKVFKFRMEAFDEDRATRSLDMHIDHVQLKKRLAMCLVERSSTKNGGDLLEDNCPICISGMTSGDSILLPCGHRFHIKCMEAWSKRASSCPTCRQ